MKKHMPYVSPGAMLAGMAGEQLSNGSSAALASG